MVKKVPRWNRAWLQSEKGVLLNFIKVADYDIDCRQKSNSVDFDPKTSIIQRERDQRTVRKDHIQME